MTTTPAPGSPAYADALLADAIGKPWECLGRGPSSYDCWGLVLHILRDGLGWAGAPDFLYSSGLDERERAFEEGMRRELDTGAWRLLDRPKPYCVMMIGQSRKVGHVGLYHPDGAIYHCFEGAGVVGTSMPAMRKLGWGLLLPYAHEEMTWLT